MRSQAAPWLNVPTTRRNCRRDRSRNQLAALCIHRINCALIVFPLQAYCICKALSSQPPSKPASLAPSAALSSRQPSNSWPQLQDCPFISPATVLRNRIVALTLSIHAVLGLHFLLHPMVLPQVISNPFTYGTAG